MNEWVQLTMDEAGYLENGLVPYFSGITRYLATADVVGYKINPSEEVSYYSRPSRAQIYLAVGDVLQAKMRETNKSFVVDSNLEGWLASTGFARFKPERVGNLPLYVYYIVTSEFFLRQRDRLCVGSTQQAISDRDLRGIYVRLPRSPQEQEKIARILQTVDRSIEKTEALIDKYQHIKSGLMHDLFTRGIGPDGQLRPPREQAPELYQETPIGWIPKDWQYELLDQLAVRGSGHTPSRSRPEYWNGDLKWLSLADSVNLDNLYVYDTKFKISESGIRNSSAVMHPAGVVVLSRDAGIGKSAITTTVMAVSQHFMCWRCGEGLNNHYLYYWLQYNKRSFENIAMGSTILTIGLQYFKRLRIECPVDMNEQKAISDALKSAEQSLFTLEQEVKKLQQQKSGLMHDLLTGKVPVQIEPEVEPEAGHV